MINIRKRNFIYFIIPFIAFVVIIVQIGPSEIAAFSQQMYAKAMKFNMVLDKIERFYIDELNPEDLVEDAIQGMLSHLDPYSAYLSADKYAKYKQETEGYYGIGVKYDLIDKHFVIISVEEHGPAFAQGLQQGDIIKAIEGIYVEGLRYGDLAQILTGPPNTDVTLLIYREGWNRPKEFIIPRLQIAIDSIPSSFLIRDNIGYIKIARFTATTADELDIAYADLRSQGMNNLILDLRDNTGGSLIGAEKVADRFISGGKIIVYTKGRTSTSSERFVATDAATLPSLPVIVLVNGITASGAEIVAGALQDWDRGLIVGEKTFGKALVQSEFPFQDGSALMLTTARYFTPLGRMIQREYKNSTKEENKTSNNKSNDIKNRPTYTTPVGRTIYGGGCIVPDIIISSKSKSISDIARRLLQAKEHIFFNFADEYVKKHPEINQDLDVYVNQFKIDEAMYQNFIDFIISSGFKCTQKELQENATEVKFIIKQELARRIWGEHGLYRILLDQDAQLLKSFDYFNQATALLNN